MAPEYTLYIPDQEPKIVGETKLATIVNAAIKVSSLEGVKHLSYLMH